VRKTITTLFAVAALAVAALAASSAALPSAAQAATCAEWRLPMFNHNWLGQRTRLTLVVQRRDGWDLWLKYFEESGYWWASAHLASDPSTIVRGGKVLFSSVTADSVRFTLRWPNGVQGTYTGTIRSDGYVSGVMVERTQYNTIYRTYWNMWGRAVCQR
jgi:hypothetical protein